MGVKTPINFVLSLHLAETICCMMLPYFKCCIRHILGKEKDNIKSELYLVLIDTIKNKLELCCAISD